MFYDMYCLQFPQNERKNWIGLQHIIAYCGSRYLGFSLQAAFVERLGEREITLYFHITHISENI
jgi:hypothetical protein